MRAHSSLRLGTLHGTTPELLASPCYCAWGFCMVWEAGLPHKTSSAPPQRRNGRACSSLTARGGGLPVGVIALIFQRIERLICDLPPRPATAHQAIDVACAYLHVGHPTEVLDLRVLYFPVLDAIDVHVGIGGIERHLIDKPKAVDNPGGAVVA